MIVHARSIFLGSSTYSFTLTTRYERQSVSMQEQEPNSNTMNKKKEQSHPREQRNTTTLRTIQWHSSAHNNKTTSEREKTQKQDKRKARNSPRNVTASLPSNNRWSYVSATTMMGRITIWPSTTTGLSLIACIPGGGSGQRGGGEWGKRSKWVGGSNGAKAGIGYERRTKNMTQDEPNGGWW
jgi:hypothetical protein